MSEVYKRCGTFLQVRSSITGNTLNAMAIGIANIIDINQIPDIINFDTYLLGLALQK